MNLLQEFEIVTSYPGALSAVDQPYEISNIDDALQAVNSTRPSSSYDIPLVSIDATIRQAARFLPLPLQTSRMLLHAFMIVVHICHGSAMNGTKAHTCECMQRRLHHGFRRGKDFKQIHSTRSDWVTCLKLIGPQALHS
jgi:hypothetical protein